MSITHNLSYLTEGLGRLLEVFKNRPRIAALLTAWLTECQAVEDAMWSVFVERELQGGTASGDLLDKIGKIVGEPREVLDDASYRILISARIKANRSSGRREELITIASLLNPGAVISIQDNYPAAVVIRPEAAVTIPGTLQANSFLEKAVTAGVRLLFEWQEDVDAAMFTTALNSMVGTATTVGGHTVVVNTAALLGSLSAFFPASGSIVLEPGGVNEETVTYTSITDPATFNIASPYVGAIHPIGSIAELVGDAGLGFEFADQSILLNPATATATTIVVDHVGHPLSFVPVTGTLILDQGLMSEETVTYSAYVSGTGTFAISALVNSHSAGATVLLVVPTIDQVGGKFEGVTSN